MATVIGYDSTKKLKTTCRACAAIVEYVPNEVKQYSYSDYGGGSDIAYKLTCPGCSHEIHVPSVYI